MTDESGSRRQVSADPAATNRSTAGPSPVRRRLLLGAGAIVPSVYTLTSGATVAVASNLKCWANQPASAPNRFTAGDDGWYRSQVYDGKFGSEKAHCVSSPQSACVDSSGKAKDGSVWMVDDGSRVTSGPYSQVTNVSSGPKSYGLVYVDQQGTVSTHDPNGKPGLNYVADSCWNSILGGRISKLG